ncbi:MAG: alanine:cation symporter family protein, partial [Alphaproteobacteria bacterium]
GEVTHFQALTAALSGTVGLGNIAGVAIAISIGGPGATFWMIMAGLFGMSTKFTECTLGVKYRRIDEEGVVSGGPMYYLWLGLKKRGEWMGRFGRGLSIFFALLCLGAAFGAGNMFQVNQSTAQFMNVMVPWLFGPDSFMADMPWLVGLAYAILVGMVIIGGIRSIVQVTERLVPLMAFIYVGAALVVIFQHADMLPAAMTAIVTGAFTPLGVAGGFFGVLIQGIRRASFSNEAGVGSAAIAHSAVKTTEPVSEGMVALLEPFVDTVVICTMTAFVIIVTGMYQTAEAADGIALTSDAFATVLPWFPYILSIAVLMFAYSTSITYYYYGERAFLFLIGPDRKWAENAYKVAYLLVLIVGSSMQLTSVMDFADAMLLAMAFPNMVGLYIMAGEVKRDLDLYLAKVKRREIRPYREVLEEEGARG